MLADRQTGLGLLPRTNADGLYEINPETSKGKRDEAGVESCIIPKAGKVKRTDAGSECVILPEPPKVKRDEAPESCVIYKDGEVKRGSACINDK